MESLVEFSKRQEEFVRRLGRQLWTLWKLNPTLDVEALAEEKVRTLPVLRGVGAREILAEVLDPGSFRNC